MSEPLQRKQPEETPLPTAEQEAAAEAVGAWVSQFARTLKNCRLYDARNVQVLRFRQQLAASLHQLIREHGSFTLRFGSDDVTYEGASLYPARSRDDNLALPFYRDGVRSVTFHDSVEPRELDALLSALIHMTGQEVGEDDDLVTMLWQAQLPHIEIDYVPAEGDVTGSTGAEDGPVAPWPTAADPTDPMDPAPRTLVDPPPGSEEGVPRSDDWAVGAPTAEFEASFFALQSIAPIEMARFLQEFEAERTVPAVVSAVALARAYIAAETHGDDLPDLAKYLPRVLRLAVQEGRWQQAEEAVSLLAELGAGWSPVTFAQELQQPISIQSLSERIAGQSEPEVRAFAVFVSQIGEPAVDVLAPIIAEMESPARARPLMEVVVKLCRPHPERLAPWLTDRRPEVVRGFVQMLGAIGGPAIPGLLQLTVRHPDPRIRTEVIAALRSVDVKSAKPLLLSALTIADTRLFAATLQKLSEARDPEVSQALLLLMIDPAFEARPPEEKHAIVSALGSTGGDEVIPELEAEMLKGGWFERVNEAYRQTIARCIARIGTPMARMVIEHAAQSRRSPVRDLCREILVRWEEYSRG